jgi:hypothetical protein
MKTPGAWPPLTLQPRNLTEGEIAKIGVFLRVGRHRLLRDWSVVRDGPCHVLVLGDARPESPLAANRDAAAILRLHEARGDQRPGTLARPLEYDAFIDALSAVERRLPTRVAAAHTAVNHAEPPTPPACAPAQGVFAIASHARFRLRRWPPAATLAAHRYNIRLASFMSGRHVGLDELLRLSNVDRSQCEQFLFSLNEAALLEVRLASGISSPVRVAPSCGDPLSERSTGERGLLERIRRRLGLRGPQ